MLCGLHKYASDTARKYNTIPKFQVHNNAVRNVYADEDFMEAIEWPKAWGRYVELAIATQTPIHDFKVYYWREKKEEVDFILVRRKKVIAIKVKSGRKTTNEG